MLAEDVMSRDPWTLRPSATVAEAIGVMQQQRVHHVLITTDDGRLVGIVSDRDLDGVLRDGGLQQPISAMARTEVVTVNRSTELHVVIDLLLARQIGAVPVVERDSHRLVGLVSTSDVLRSVRALV